ncbi:MAG TPA: hypothetical protein VKP30_19945, partial [Polyangiaceae bacterium]|nr:hypothetical protein [Polyangiaceae bacterium]
VAAVTFTASFQKIFSASPKIGFLAAARTLQAQITKGQLSAGKAHELSRTAFNLHVDAFVAGFFLAMVAAIVLVSVARWIRILRQQDTHPLTETPPVWLADSALVEPERRGLLRAAQGASLVVLGLLPATSRSGANNCSGECAHRGLHTVRASSSRDALGREWAAREVERFERPRCC